MPEPRPDDSWNEPQPARLPRPTYWPAALALGLTLLLWGLVTMWIISGLGLLVFAVALGGWIRELLYER